MILKKRDASSARIATLRQLEATESDTFHRQNIQHAIARLVSDSTSSHACKMIDSLFADCPDWVVLHDLHLNVNQRILKINHLLINNVMEFFIIDTRYLNFGLTVSDSGIWHAGTSNVDRLISSPMNKMNKDIRILKTILKVENILPRHCGITRPASIKGCVLTNPALRSQVPSDVTASPGAVLASDALFRHVWKETDHWLNKRIRPESTEMLCQVARTIMSLHQPIISTQFLPLCESDYSTQPDSAQDTAHCAYCGNGVAENIREQCFRNMEQLEGKILCSLCQSRRQVQQPAYASH